MYFDERLSRTRATIGGDNDDDEVVAMSGSHYRGIPDQEDEEEDDADSLPARP
jgi:hypothetical protein